MDNGFYYKKDLSTHHSHQCHETITTFPIKSFLDGRLSNDKLVFAIKSFLGGRLSNDKLVFYSMDSLDF